MNRRGFLGAIAAVAVLGRYGYNVAKSATAAAWNGAEDSFGDGRDGNILLDGKREFPFATLDRATKTYLFTRTVYAQNLALMPGVRLGWASPWGLYVRDTLDYRHGEIIGLPVSSFGVGA